MKKIILLFAILLLVNQFSNAQSVTLSTTAANPTKGTVYFNNTTNQLQYWNGSAWVSLTNSNAGTGWALSGTNLYNTNTGFVGIGVNAPEAPLTVKASGIGISQQNYAGTMKIGFYTEDSDATLQTHSSHNLTFATNNSSAQMTLQKGTGNLGIGVGVTNPVNKLQIGLLGSTGFSGYHFAIGNGTNAMGIYQTNTSTIISSSKDIVLRTNTYGGGRVGINAESPVNTLQIGSVGSTGYAGNDIAFGNGTQVGALSQSSTALSIASNTKIVLLPNNSGSAVSIGDGLISTSNSRVGINTTTPRAPLDVMSWVNQPSMPFAYFRASASDGHAVVTNTLSAVPSVSIYAEQSVLAIQFIAVSDARIKNIVGISNSAHDLATVRALQITDYTMKDTVQHGIQVFKKVIAQQVERVYPQAVTQITDVVPDIYALAEKVIYDETNKTLKCSLPKNYDIKVGEKIQFIHPTAGKLKAEAIAVSGNTFTVKDWQYATDKIFVYGREVNDFRSVDYEAISMLGISAIQQLAKENEELKKKNEEFSRKFELLSVRLEAIEAQLPKTPTGN